MNKTVKPVKQPDFLPMSRKDMDALGWDTLDVLIISGDAYVDHPGFGAAMIGRVLVSAGFKTGIIAQPDWKNPKSIYTMGKPRLMVGITAGAMDSMVANYTANKKLRRQDAYAPNGEYGKRPNRASLVYTSMARQQFPGCPVVLGGIEASLRRLVHYDYWTDSIRRSVLVDAKADYLIYGMAEKSIVQLATALSAQQTPHHIKGLVYIGKEKPATAHLTLPGYEEIDKHWTALADAAIAEEENRCSHHIRPLIQAHGHRYVIVNPPADPLTEKEMDRIYRLPFKRAAHPVYKNTVPALEPVRHSVISHRGCFGGCSFCALGAHQGKLIQSRSEQSILSEIDMMTGRSDFRGTVTDIGGPSANMYQMSCQNPKGPCKRPSCLYPNVCKHINTDHHAVINLLKKIKANKRVKHAFIASGVRYDLALMDKRYITELIKQGYISGALKVAPEHVDDDVLALMRKPKAAVFEAFLSCYKQTCKQFKKGDYITAYFITAFPGSTREKMKKVTAFARKWHLRVEQLQDFIPLPMTMAGIMYALEKELTTKRKLIVAKTDKARKAQRLTLLDHRPKMKKLRINPRKNE